MWIYTDVKRFWMNSSGVLCLSCDLGSSVQRSALDVGVGVDVACMVFGMR